MKLRTGDTVKVTVGKFKGTIAKILKIDNKRNKAVLETDVVSVKHKKPVGDIPGEITTIPKAIDISNLSFYDDEAKKTSRVAYRTDKQGKKVRHLVQIDKEIK